MSVIRQFTLMWNVPYRSTLTRKQQNELQELINTEDFLRERGKNYEMDDQRVFWWWQWCQLIDVHKCEAKSQKFQNIVHQLLGGE